MGLILDVCILSVYILNINFLIILEVFMCAITDDNIKGARIGLTIPYPCRENSSPNQNLTGIKILSHPHRI